MQYFSLNEHFLELKNRILKIFLLYILAFSVCYYYKAKIFNFLLMPIAKLNPYYHHKIIYTGLTEAFFTYLKLAMHSSFLIIMPIIAYQIYNFLKPGLHKQERRIAFYTFSLAPILFWTGGLFVFYYVMPRAWQFFLSFEQTDILIPIILEARISEYLSLVLKLVFAFGLAFQLPIIMVILNILKIVKVQNLRNKRRLATVLIFVVAGIITPPDVISQFALAIPMILLYEISIIVCKLVESRRTDVGY